ncbi:MAG: aspartate/glutamate racemase family protein [Nitrincola sp.]|nr:aspartate/glutamate racemase family protein [Nitrincola sp.]
MKTIGLIGGMSWESTQTYYRLINEGVKAELGGLHSAKLVLYSVDFAEIESLQHQGNWPATAEILIIAAQALERAGADFIVICTNTMHKVAEQVQLAISIPLLHIADATARVLKNDKIKRVGLLGTRFTMEQTFYRERLEHQGIQVIIPNDVQRVRVHTVIYNELCLGKINNESKQDYLEIVRSLKDQGAEGVILGCTEIGLLIQRSDTDVTLYDTTEIHAQEAVNVALNHLKD